MNIRELMQKLHNTSNEKEKEEIKKEILSQFSSLDEFEKEIVRKEFLKGLDEKFKEADNVLEKVDIALNISEISKYISLSQISSVYFGKSKEWLYQRIKGYSINGKRAEFSESDRKKVFYGFRRYQSHGSRDITPDCLSYD